MTFKEREMIMCLWIAWDEKELFDFRNQIPIKN